MLGKLQRSIYNLVKLILFLCVVLGAAIDGATQRVPSPYHRAHKADQFMPQFSTHVNALQILFTKWQQSAIYQQVSRILGKTRFLLRLLNTYLMTAAPFTLRPKRSVHALYPTVGLRWLQWLKVARRLVR